MTVTGAGAVYNPHWSTIGNIKNWLRKQKEGTVLAAAQPYLHHMAGSEKLIQDWDGVLGEKGGSVLVSAGCLGGGGRVGGHGCGWAQGSGWCRAPAALRSSRHHLALP